MNLPTRNRLSLFIMLLLSPTVWAEDWPMFGRSQSRNAVSPEKNPPTWWQVEQRDEGMPRELWKLDMRKDLGVYPSWDAMGWGKTCSIGLPYEDFIYVQTGNGGPEDFRVVAPKAPSLVCLDKRTGKLIWSDNSP